MLDKHRKPKVGLLFLAADRFCGLGKGTPRGTYENRIQKQVAQITGALSQQCELYNNTLIVNNTQVQSAIQCFVQNDVDIILTVFLSWAEDAAMVRLLRDIPDFPMILYCPVKEEVTPPAGISDDDLVEFLSLGGLVGALEVSGSFVRQNQKVEVLAGTVDDTLDEMLGVINAARAAKLARHAVFGLMSSYNELMWSTYVNPYQFFVQAGPQVRFITYHAYAQAIAKVSDAHAQAYCKELADTYAMEKDIDPTLFLESARASLGLYGLAQEYGVDVLSINDVDHELLSFIGLRPGFYCESWNKDGSIVLPEADLGAAYIAFVLKTLTQSNVNFVEPFYMDKKRNLFSAGHAGPHNHTGQDNQPFVRIAPDIRFRSKPIRYAGAPFAWLRIPPGKKTFVHFSESHETYKIVCFQANAIEGPHMFPSYSHGEFVPEMPVNELFKSVIQKGVNQHFAMVNQDVLAELEVFARINNFEFHKIG